MIITSFKTQKNYPTRTVNTNCLYTRLEIYNSMISTLYMLLKSRGQNAHFLVGANDRLKSFLILPGVNFGYNLFQLSLGLTLWEVAHIIILWGHPENTNIE